MYEVKNLFVLELYKKKFCDLLKNLKIPIISVPVFSPLLLSSAVHCKRCCLSYSLNTKMPVPLFLKERDEELHISKIVYIS